MTVAPRLVVRSHAPLRRLLLLSGVLLLAALATFIAYEWGAGNAGFDVRSARSDISQLQSRIRQLEGENHRQRLQLAEHETERIGQIRERTELARTIGDLQAQVARGAQDLAFYRGVVGDNVSAEVVKIQQFRVTRGAAANEFQLRLVLGRPLRPEDTISGKVRLTFEGVMAATPLSLDLSKVSAVAAGELEFSYRYVQTLEQAISLPQGFVPARTTVELVPARKGVNPVRETFIWTVENG